MKAAFVVTPSRSPGRRAARLVGESREHRVLCACSAPASFIMPVLQRRTLRSGETR